MAVVRRPWRQRKSTTTLRKRNEPITHRVDGNVEDETADELQIESANDFLEPGTLPRVEMLDYYQYRPVGSFDSALLDPAGTKEPEDWREAYCVLVRDEKGCPPATETQAVVQSQTTAEATVTAAIVDPKGLSTNYWVEYGKTTAYGRETEHTELANPSGEQSEMVALEGLESCTTYHYQVEAENEANEGEPALGGDRTFTTDCIKAIAGGWGHFCQLLVGGSVECWGENYAGQLGDGTTEYSATPVPVVGITNAVAITAGWEYSCATLAEGSVECWGGGSSGELGNGSEAGSLVPERVSGISGAVDVVAAGSEHACAIASAGGVECWGANGSGQAPGPVEGLTGPAIGGGGGLNFTCALLASGSVECWGDNSGGELGDGSTTRSTRPVAVSGITTATSLTAGGDGFACASLADGAVECWGNHSSTPVPVSGISDATAVSGGGSFVCALRSTGEVDCWADSDSLTAEPVSGITDATAIAATSGEACAVLGYTTVYCWRESGSGGGGGGGDGGGGGGPPT